MDSDDDFMSPVSSEDDILPDDSDNDDMSGAEGCPLASLQHVFCLPF
jgi:hypothetical protein